MLQTPTGLGCFESFDVPQSAPPACTNFHPPNATTLRDASTKPSPRAVEQQPTTTTMERKRKLPARGARAEPASKKRAPSGTPDEPRQTSTPIPTVPPPVQEESLPKSIAPGKPLPTLEEPQPENLSSKEFQTVSER